MTESNLMASGGNFGGMQHSNAFMNTEIARAAKEVEAAVAVAKRFPRDTVAAQKRILEACSRKVLAEQAMYAYPRGSETVTGPSIRLAETMAQNWGNMQYGIRELSQGVDETTLEAFAWDVETNVRATRVFTMAHVRYTKAGGRKALVDPRDIYENNANHGARRLRAVILEIIPADVVESAIQRCEGTMKGGSEPLAERAANMVTAFADFRVTKDMIEARLGHKIEAIREAELVQMIKIFRSIKDGAARAEDFFGSSDDGAKQDAASQLNQRKPGPVVQPKTAAAAPQGSFDSFQAGPPPAAAPEAGASPLDEARATLFSEMKRLNISADITVEMSKHHFQKDLADLNLEQTLSLTGIVRDVAAAADAKVKKGGIKK